jgi:hypothetical protein
MQHHTAAASHRAAMSRVVVPSLDSDRRVPSARAPRSKPDQDLGSPDLRLAELSDQI